MHLHQIIAIYSKCTYIYMYADYPLGVDSSTPVNFVQTPTTEHPSSIQYQQLNTAKRGSHHHRRSPSPSNKRDVYHSTGNDRLLSAGASGQRRQQRRRKQKNALYCCSRNRTDISKHNHRPAKVKLSHRLDLITN